MTKNRAFLKMALKTTNLSANASCGSPTLHSHEFMPWNAQLEVYGHTLQPVCINNSFLVHAFICITVYEKKNLWEVCKSNTYMDIFLKKIKHSIALHSHVRQREFRLFYLKKQRPQSPSAAGSRTASWDHFKAVGEIKTQRLTDLCCPSDLSGSFSPWVHFRLTAKWTPSVVLTC